MPRPRMYSIEEVLNFTVKDIQGPNFVDVKIKGWLRLTSEQREECIMKLRDLVRQRDEIDEIAQSKAVDASVLEERLNRVDRSLSPTLILPLFDPDNPEHIAKALQVEREAQEVENRLYQVDRSRSATSCDAYTTPPYEPYDPDKPEEIEKVLKVEREAHEALVNNNGQPCYPIELGLDVFKNPGQYKDIFEYWQMAHSLSLEEKGLIFTVQLERWKKFRQFQQKNRRYFVFYNRFPEFQQQVLERRRRHGLGGDIQLLEEQNKQSKLDDWMEYQDYELRTYEYLEKDLEETQERLVSRRKALTDAGLSAFEGIQELELAKYNNLADEWCCKVPRRDIYKELAERKLRLAEKKKKMVESADLGERFERASWVGLFVKEVQSTQMQLDELQSLAESAIHDLEPYKRWWYAKRVEWDEKMLEIPEEAKRAIKLEVESAEFQERYKELGNLRVRQYEAWIAPSTAKEEAKFAKEVLKAARSDDLGETVERAALIKLTQEEVRSAQTDLEKVLKEIELKWKVRSELDSISCIKGRIERHNVLLEWVEQQHQEIAASCAPTQKKGGQGRSKRASLRALQNRPVIEASRTDNPSKANGRKRKQSTTRSILSPVDPAKISKAPSKRQSPRQKISVPCGASQTAEKTTTDSSIPESRSKQAFKVNAAMPASLRPIHSSRVSKPDGNGQLDCVGMA